MWCLVPNSAGEYELIPPVSEVQMPHQISTYKTEIHTEIPSVYGANS